MNQSKRQTVNVDTTIHGLNEHINIVKIIGIILKHQKHQIVIGDSTGQLTIMLGDYSKKLKVEDRGRFTIRIYKNEKKLNASLITFQNMNSKLIEQYTKIVKLENRIPK